MKFIKRSWFLEAPGFANQLLCVERLRRSAHHWQPTQAANGTLARRIIDGAKQVSIFGENIPVRARIYTFNGFSAHADQAELLAWQKQTSAKRTFLVHGEDNIMR
jgi:Cft2 family RNA processing exonuclease